MNALVISKDKNFSKQIADVLKSAKEADVALSASLKDAKSKLEKTSYNLLVVDWAVSQKDIPAFIHEIKKESAKNCIFVINTAGTKFDEISALNAGADDYKVVSFNNEALNEGEMRVFITRIDTRLRFGGTNVINIGDLIIDPDEEKIFYKNKEIELKGKPFEVLTHLAKHKEQIVSKEQLLDAIWEEPELVTPNVIEVAINQIRQKMDKPLGIGTIETVRRRGYRFCFPNCAGE